MTKKICTECGVLFICETRDEPVCGFCRNPEPTLEDKVRDLKAYLLSSKFHKDTTVQVDDVLRRLE